MSDYRTSVDIDASPEAVFRFLLTEKGMTAWMGQWASLDPVPGGHFAVDIAGYPARGSFLEIDPPRRVTVSWGFAGSDTLPPGASTVSFELTAIDTGTRLELTHSGLPDADLAGHRDGWLHFLPRLAQAAAGIPPAPDTWTPDRTTDHTEDRHARS